MSNVNVLQVEVKTGSREMASGTDGHVFLGIGGREFNLVIDPQKDFQNGSTDTFVLGEGTNIGTDPRDNDPRSPHQMVTETLSKYPIYMRLEPTREDDRWEIDEINVTVNPGSEQVTYSAFRRRAPSSALAPRTRVRGRSRSFRRRTSSAR